MIPVSFDLKDIWDDYYIHAKFGAQKAFITVGKVP